MNDIWITVFIVARARVRMFIHRNLVHREEIAC